MGVTEGAQKVVMVMVEERVEEGSGSVAEAAKDRATEVEAAEVGGEAEANEEEGLAVARVATGGVAAKMAVEEKEKVIHVVRSNLLH